MASWRERINPQPMFDVLSMARAREAQGNYVARMEIGDTPGFRNDHIHELVTEYSSSPYRYSPSRGEDILISKVLETQWPAYSEENVIVGPANFLITAALASVTSPRDYVLLPDPGFATYRLAADFLGLKTIYYPVSRDGSPSFPNILEIVRMSVERPRAVIINNPSNPLGVAFDAKLIIDSLGNLPELGVNVIFDETYVNLIYDQTQVGVDSIPGIRLRSFSKEHCAPGLRVGYAVATPESAVVMADLMSLSISCVPQFIQFAVADYLGSPESIDFTSNLKREMGRRFNSVTETLPQKALKTSPNAAFYLLLEAGERGGDEAFKFLLDRNVSTCPGSKFGDNSEDAVRISLAGASENFERDIEMLRIAMTEWCELDN